MIRKYKNEDLDIIMKIWQEENIKAHNFIPSKYWESNYEYVKKILPNAEIWVYTIEDNVVGFIGLNDTYIEGIFVNSNYHNKGIGTKLLKYLMEQKAKLSLRVYEKNDKAIKFYKNNSFRIQTKELEEGTGEYEYLMEWSFSNILYK